MALDDSRPTPAHVRNDGHSYHPTHRLVLFGHHFAAITGVGLLIGPVLAAQFGYGTGIIWLVAGVCLASAVHDFIILWASTRRDGRSLVDIARTVAGATAAVAILFIIVIALAGLGLAVVNALQESAWGTFTIGVSIPLALWVWRRPARQVSFPCQGSGALRTRLSGRCSLITFASPGQPIRSSC